MAVALKRKRKIFYNDKMYLWYVEDDLEYSFGKWINIFSEDKKFRISHKIDDFAQIVTPKLVAEVIKNYEERNF